MLKSFSFLTLADAFSKMCIITALCGWRKVTFSVVFYANASITSSLGRISSQNVSQ